MIQHIHRKESHLNNLCQQSGKSQLSLSSGLTSTGWTEAQEGKMWDILVVQWLRLHAPSAGAQARSWSGNQVPPVTTKSWHNQIIKY